MLVIYFSILAIGIFANTALIVLGSLASQRYNFSFSQLGSLSLLLYFGVSYAGASLITTLAGITLAGLLGLFEATIGLKLVIRLGAKIEDMADGLNEVLDENANPHPNIVMIMVFAYMFIGWMGTLFA